MRTRVTIEVTCCACYLVHRTAITPEYIERHFFEPLEGALETVESTFLEQLEKQDGWRIDDERLLCKGCAERERTNAE